MSYLTGFLLIIPVFCDFVSHLVPNDIRHSALISDFEKYKYFVSKLPNCTKCRFNKWIYSVDAFHRS